MHLLTLYHAIICEAVKVVYLLTLYHAIIRVRVVYLLTLYHAIIREGGLLVDPLPYFHYMRAGTHKMEVYGALLKHSP